MNFVRSPSRPGRFSSVPAAAIVLAAALLFGPGVGPAPAAAQEKAPTPAQERPTADSADVATPGAIVAAAYDVISGAAGEARDWDRFRSLFLPEARLIPTGRGPDGSPRYQVLTVEEFVESATASFAERGFWEREIHAETERFGDLAHVLSTYETWETRPSADAEPVARGINSFQLWHDGERWWIVDIYWHGEREDAPIPDHYGG